LGLGVQLPQTYETLAEALAVAQQMRHSRPLDLPVADQGKYWLTLTYRLDMSQMPKPLQIGLLGRGDWSILAKVRQPLKLLLQDGMLDSKLDSKPDSKPEPKADDKP
jgi:hypothetical protein